MGGYIRHRIGDGQIEHKKVMLSYVISKSQVKTEKQSVTFLNGGFLWTEDG